MARPKIFNTHQGAQFTADAFTACLLAANIQVSIDGRIRLDAPYFSRFVVKTLGPTKGERPRAQQFLGLGVSWHGNQIAMGYTVPTDSNRQRQMSWLEA